MKSFLPGFLAHTYPERFRSQTRSPSAAATAVTEKSSLCRMRTGESTPLLESEGKRDMPSGEFDLYFDICAPVKAGQDRIVAFPCSLHMHGRADTPVRYPIPTGEDRNC